jgi:hypothetical protein
MMTSCQSKVFNHAGLSSIVGRAEPEKLSYIDLHSSLNPLWLQQDRSEKLNFAQIIVLTQKYGTLCKSIVLGSKHSTSHKSIGLLQIPCTVLLLRSSFTRQCFMGHQRDCNLQWQSWFLTNNKKWFRRTQNLTGPPHPPSITVQYCTVLHSIFNGKSAGSCRRQATSAYRHKIRSSFPILCCFISVASDLSRILELQHLFPISSTRRSAILPILAIKTQKIQFPPRRTKNAISGKLPRTTLSNDARLSWTSADAA